MPEGIKSAEGEPPVRRRILCIDGGGLLGTFPAAVLAGLEEHAEHFVSRLAQRLGAAEDFGRRPICVSPYDAELFGHWWFEGPEWLDRVLRRLATGEQAIRTTTPSEYLAANREAPRCAPA